LKGENKMMTKFVKYTALGNDYIVIDPQTTKINLNTENIKRICNRNFGIGSDGILYGPQFVIGRIFLKIYNPDGSEAEKSGNGIRIFSKYLREKGYINDTCFNIQTKGGMVEANVLSIDNRKIKVNMGSVSFNSEDIPVRSFCKEVIRETIEIEGVRMNITCLTIGNPHCVVEMNDVSREIAEKYGPLIENHQIFPNRTNVQFMRIIDNDNIKIEIWERGAGYTLASGSSSCAAASAAYKLGLTGRNINVHMPGGQIKIEICDNNQVWMTGIVDSIYEGEFSEQFERELSEGGY
jgi:diaminopimelate epimerase